MFAILHALGMFVADLFKSRCRLEAENLLLRHQLTIAMRQAPPRLRLRGSDRALLIWMTRLWPSLLGAVQVVQPETILRWHRAGFKMFWRWKSRHRAGRPRIDRSLRDLIRRRIRDAPQSGFSASCGCLALRWPSRRSRNIWCDAGTHRRNPGRRFCKITLRRFAAIDMCAVPTLNFDLLFVFLVLGHGRRRLLWCRVAGPSNYRGVSLGLGASLPGARQRPCLRTFLYLPSQGHGYPRPADLSGSPWQNGCAERLIGTLRCEYLDQVVIFGEAHLRRVLSAYAAYYNQARTHLALQKDAPLHRAVQRSGAIVAIPILAGLHDQYVRI